jgi:hypothetical protein
MRWTMLVLNIIGAIAFMMLAGLATVAHRTHAYSTYRELEVNGALVAKPTYKNGEALDVEARLRKIGGGGYYSVFGYSGAAACLINGVVLFFWPRLRRPDNAA